MSPKEISRRKALALLGAAGAGAVVLGACNSDGDGGSATDTTGTSGTTDTTASGGGTSSTSAGSGASSGTTLSADAFQGASTCTVTPSQTEGPYYIDVDMLRGDIREDRQGAPLRVGARVVDSDGCTPLKDAVFEIWHCDAGGLYSGFESASTGAGGGPGGGPGGGVGSTDATRYLRGAQVTNADGIAEITTVYPGWYPGRTVHIHAKVFLNGGDVLTTQLYFDDDFTDAVYARAPYSSRSNRSTRNDDDGIYRSETTLTVTKDGDGYLGLITIGVRA